VCGHVFCWKCLQQWVSSRGECPLCRTACLPQDILALHSYTPATE
jgi:peroxin-10